MIDEIKRGVSLKRAVSLPNPPPRDNMSALVQELMKIKNVSNYDNSSDEDTVIDTDDAKSTCSWTEEI